jgi:hypothetical protein
MADIFLSYASDDIRAIRPLVKALEREGWTVFWDREIPLGKTWRQILDEQLSEARCVVVVWTKTSVARRWVIEEAEEGQSRGVLIPVFLDPVDAPRGFRGVQGAHLMNWRRKADDEEFQRLRDACRAVIGEPGQPPPEPRDSTKPPGRSVSRIKWIAGALTIALAVGGSWLWYQGTQKQAEAPAAPVKEPAPKPDPLLSALQYKEACDRGSQEDCKRLGDLYASGRGIGEDPLRAAALYRQACDAEVASACVGLGSLYQKGRAVPKDEERAASLYKQACEAGLQEGCQRLERLDKLRTERMKEAAQAVESQAAKRPAPATPAEPRVERRAELRVTVLPWGDVWINGKSKRRAPLEVSLKPGKYTISAGQGTPTKSRVIRLKPGEKKTEHFDLVD